MRLRTITLAVLMAVAISGLCSCGGSGDAGVPPENRSALLKAVTTWGYQLQELERAGAIDALAASTYEMLVIDPTRTVQGSEGFDTAGTVARLKTLPDGKRRLVFAYVDIGQAEDYRTYWQADWVPPTLNGPGDPDFMVTVDPDGWEGNYPVAYWDPAWQDIIFDAAGSMLDAVLADGFDGIYMDWIGGYEEDAIIARAAADGVDPADEVVRFIRRLRNMARGRDNQFLLIAQNASDLATGHADYLNIISGIAQEDLYFSGDSDAGWSDPGAGDIPTPNPDRQWLVGQLDVYRNAGLPVFTIDYALVPANMNQAYQGSRARGYVPFVSRISLDRLP